MPAARARRLLLVLVLAAPAWGRGKGRGARRRERLAAEQQQLPQRLCDDSCPTARNGLCEDGSLLVRAQKGSPAYSKKHALRCDLGTDCADCGPIVGSPARFAALEAMMPGAGAPAVDSAARREAGGLSGVALLRAQGVPLFAAWTATQPSFIMPFTDGRLDFDVSRNMESNRVVESLYNMYWHQLSRQCCARDGLMLDVGSNFGYYALYAAALGCRVVAWEPVPVFRAFVEVGARLNNFSHRIHLRGAVVSDVPNRSVNVTVPKKGIWGTASVGGLNVDPSIPSPTYSVAAPTESLDQMVSEQACIMKLDVEGYEPSVVKGAKATLTSRPPLAILTEYTPGVIERLRAWRRLMEYPASLRTFAAAGYSIWHLVGVQKNDRGRDGADWATEQLPALAAVTAATLKAEEANARNMAADRSFAVPWDLHPRSLHAEFSHNTDLLLTLDRAPGVGTLVGRSRDVGIYPDSSFGLGGGVCMHVLRDGTAAELIGRLCVSQSRNDSIAAAVATAELPRPLKRGGAWHHRVTLEAKQWLLLGKLRSPHRRMVRKGSEEALAALRAIETAAAARGGGRGGGRGGRGRGRGGGGGGGRGGGSLRGKLAMSLSRQKDLLMKGVGKRSEKKMKAAWGRNDEPQ